MNAPAAASIDEGKWADPESSGWEGESGQEASAWDPSADLAVAESWNDGLGTTWAAPAEGDDSEAGADGAAQEDAAWAAPAGGEDGGAEQDAAAWESAGDGQAWSDGSGQDAAAAWAADDGQAWTDGSGQDSADAWDAADGQVWNDGSGQGSAASDGHAGSGSSRGNSIPKFGLVTKEGVNALFKPKIAPTKAGSWPARYAFGNVFGCKCCTRLCGKGSCG